MKWPKESGTIILVTVVTVLVWILAAAKTREVDTVAGQIDLQVASDTSGDQFQVSPSRVPVSVTLEGPAIAVRQARQLLISAPLAIPLPAEHGRVNIDSLAAEVRAVERLRDTGVTVLSTEPPSLSVDVTEFIVRAAVTRARFPEAATVQDISIAPQEVTVRIPRSALHDIPESLTAEARIDQRDLVGLEPGVLQTIDATLGLVDSGTPWGDVAISPSTARVSFRLVARHRSLTVPRVRIQIASAPQDFGTWEVVVPQSFLADVEIEAALDVIEAVEKGQAQVIAVVHLTTNDKERTIDSKPVSFFAVIDADGIASPVRGSVGGDSHPEISLEITSVEN